MTISSFNNINGINDCADENSNENVDNDDLGKQE